MKRAAAVAVVCVLFGCQSAHREPASNASAAATSSSTTPIASASATASDEAPTVERYCRWFEAQLVASVRKSDPEMSAERAKDMVSGMVGECVTENTKRRGDDRASWTACANCQMGSADLDDASSKCKATCTPKEKPETASKQEIADDFRKNVCDALEASKIADADAKAKLKKVLDWSFEHAATKPSKRTVGAVRLGGVDPTWIAAIVREGGHEAGYDGPCALADAFEKTYPCPPGAPHRCGKDRDR